MLEDVQAEGQKRLAVFFGRDVPEALYHYTGPAGLSGVLCSKQLQCTQVQYLNDAQELYYAADLVAGLVEKNPGLDAFGAVRAYAIDFAATRKLSRICVASFSEDRDDQGQWRGYSSGSNGFAIGFYGEALGEELRHQPPTNRGGIWNLAPVIYELDDHLAVASIVIELINKACQAAIGDGASYDEAAAHGNTAFLSLVLSIGPLLKHPAFAAEREWRLVSPNMPHGHGHLGFRPNKLVTPYCSFRLCQPDATLRLAEILVGPGPHQELNRGAADALRFEEGIHMPAEPALSAVPYRDW